MNEKELLIQVEHWARLGLKNHKIYIGLRESFIELDKLRKLQTKLFRKKCLKWFRK